MICDESRSCTYCGRSRDVKIIKCHFCGGEETGPCPGCPACGERGYLGIIPADVKIIGMAGRAGSGKDFIARNYFYPCGYRKIAFAEVFKYKVVGMGATFEEAFDTKPEIIRHMLQAEGSEIGRDVFGRQLWLRALEARIYQFYKDWRITKFILTDVRFKNELRWIKSLGAAVVFVESDRVHQMDDKAMVHQSEVEMATIPKDEWSYILTNNFDTEQGKLDMQVTQFMEKFGVH